MIHVQDVAYEDLVSVEHFFSVKLMCNITSDLKRKIEIKVSIQRSLHSGRCLMAIIHIHLIIYFLECGIKLWASLPNHVLKVGF